MKKIIIFLMLSFMTLSVFADYPEVEVLTPEQIEQDRLAILQAAEEVQIQIDEARIKYNELYQEAISNLSNQDLGNSYAVTEPMIFAEMTRLSEIPEVIIDTTPINNDDDNVPVSSGVITSTGTGLGEGGFSMVELMGIIALLGGLFLILTKLGVPLWLIILILVVVLGIIVLLIKNKRKGT